MSTRLDAPAAWERGSFTSQQRFHAFAHLRDLPVTDRSTLRAYNEHRTTCLRQPGARMVSGRWKSWSTEDDWAARLALWDAEVDRQQRAKLVKARVEAVERHQRLVAAALNTVFVPVRSVLSRLSDPAFVASIETSPVTLLRESLRAVQILPALINAERLALGLTTESVEVEDRRTDREIADRIVSDPATTALAVELLDRIAKNPADAKDPDLIGKTVDAGLSAWPKPEAL